MWYEWKSLWCTAFVVNDFLLSNTRVCFNIDGTPGYGGYGNHYEPSQSLLICLLWLGAAALHGWIIFWKILIFPNFCNNVFFKILYISSFFQQLKPKITVKWICLEMGNIGRKMIKIGPKTVSFSKKKNIHSCCSARLVSAAPLSQDLLGSRLWGPGPW